MLEQIYYLITLSNPQTQHFGKIIIFQKQGIYETQWVHLGSSHEECDIYYTGSDLEEAAHSAESIREAKEKEGFTGENPSFAFSLSAIPKSLLLIRKLEYFCQKYKDNNLFTELRKWRKSTADKAGIPPYFIASDKLLCLIAALVPHHAAELMQIPGIGRNKLDQYGQPLLSITAKYPQAYSFPLDWIHDKVSHHDLISWMIQDKLVREEKNRMGTGLDPQRRLRLLECIQEQIPLTEASERMDSTPAVLIKQIRVLAQEGYDVLPYLKREVDLIKERELIQSWAAKLGTSRLKPIFEQMYGNGDSFAQPEKGEKYNHIRLICTYLQLQSA